jgi:hypothetical protein
MRSRGEDFALVNRLLALSVWAAEDGQHQATMGCRGVGPGVVKGPKAGTLFGDRNRMFRRSRVDRANRSSFVTRSTSPDPSCAILGGMAHAPTAVPYAVGLYITSAYWFTASTSFANPAVTLARSLSDTFAGIAPGGVLPLIAAQLAGMLTAVVIGAWLWPKECVKKVANHA